MTARRAGFTLSLFTVAAALAAPASARADEGFTSTSVEPRERVGKEPDPFRTKPGYVQLFATALIGSGLRFNNPYRLATPLGDDAESVSRTASYVDIGIAATFGNPLGLQHGMALRTSAAIEGVGQIVMTPSYLAWRRWRSLAAFGRLGVPLVVTPDVTWGLEAGVGGAWFFMGGFGVAAEIVGDMFYGAGTAEAATTSYPVLSGQLGFIATYEVLP